MVKLLLEEGADIEQAGSARNPTSTYYWPPTCCLLPSQAEARATNQHMRCAYVYGGVRIDDAAYHYLRLCRPLLPPPRRPWQMKDTPLIRASNNGHLHTVQYLLEQGADPNTLDLVRRRHHHHDLPTPRVCSSAPCSSCCGYTTT